MRTAVNLFVLGVGVISRGPACKPGGHGAGLIGLLLLPLSLAQATSRPGHVYPRPASGFARQTPGHPH